MGVPDVTIEKIADSAWLRAMSRVALPFMTFILYIQFTSLQDMAQRVPKLEMRIENLEKSQAAVTVRADVERKERVENQQDVMVQLGQVTIKIQSLEAGGARIERAIDSLNELIVRKKNSALDLIMR